MKSAHSDRLERYLGTAKVNEISELMRGWYGPPIALHGVPGQVYATKDGDFVGNCAHGFEMSMWDHGWDLMKRLKRAARTASGRERYRLNAGFASLSDILTEITTNGKKQDLYFNIVGQAGVSPGSSSAWAVGTLPRAGGAGSAAPGGRACTSATIGAMNAFQNPAGGDNTYLLSTTSKASAAGALLLYDRLFDVAKTMSSSATEAVTGVPTRYQSTSPGADDYVGGNFLFPEIGTTLSATAHNWTVCTYTDQGGAAGTFPSQIGISAGIAPRMDMTTNRWFMDLAAGDCGVQTLTQMQCSSAALTGAVNFVIGHPLAWMTHPILNAVVQHDYVNSLYVLPRVFDDACLTFLEPLRQTSGGITYTGHLVLASG